MDSTDFEIFLAIVNNRSLSKAAESLNFAQSTLSHRLCQLEESIGAPLVERRKGQRTIELTPEGLEFEALAKRWLSLHEEASMLADRSARHRLTVAGAHSLNCYVFPEFFQNLIRESPVIELTILALDSSRIYELMDSRALDAGFTNSNAAYSNIISTPLFKDRFCILRKAIPGRAPEAVHPSDLNPEKEIYHNWYAEFEQWHDYWWKPSKPMTARVNLAQMLPYFIADDEHWSIVPYSVARGLSMNGSLELCELISPPPARICYLVEQKYPRPHVVHSLDIFRERLHDFLKKLSGYDLLIP